jgi:hypothetical protein
MQERRYDYEYRWGISEEIVGAILKSLLMNCTGAKAVLSQIKDCCYSILFS